MIPALKQGKMKNREAQKLVEEGALCRQGFLMQDEIAVLRVDKSFSNIWVLNVALFSSNSFNVLLLIVFLIGLFQVLAIISKLLAN